MEEGTKKVHQFWEGSPWEDRHRWMIPVNQDAQILAEDIRSLENELQERCILIKNGDDTLIWGYSQKGTFSIKEAYNIKIRD